MMRQLTSLLLLMIAQTVCGQHTEDISLTDTIDITERMSKEYQKKEYHQLYVYSKHYILIQLEHRDLEEAAAAFDVLLDHEMKDSLQVSGYSKSIISLMLGDKDKFFRYVNDISEGSKRVVTAPNEAVSIRSMSAPWPNSSYNDKLKEIYIEHKDFYRDVFDKEGLTDAQKQVVDFFEEYITTPCYIERHKQLMRGMLKYHIANQNSDYNLFYQRSLFQNSLPLKEADNISAYCFKAFEAGYQTHFLSKEATPYLKANGEGGYIKIASAYGIDYKLTTIPAYIDIFFGVSTFTSRVSFRSGNDGRVVPIGSSINLIEYGFNCGIPIYNNRAINVIVHGGYSWSSLNYNTTIKDSKSGKDKEEWYKIDNKNNRFTAGITGHFRLLRSYSYEHSYIRFNGLYLTVCSKYNFDSNANIFEVSKINTHIGLAYHY
ncbi:hypothetical protein K5X82_14935 [Halosquirtibacter xylanolyticus]|uniref:hypothetical protein n=1 Tax=Halosquirtibacter xylanolyticus TaxID=3374599 RepID=UPI003748585E|nr:hypothetical protein K5X82_14935 [Prolixibacteraceae bacterium]